MTTCLLCAASLLVARSARADAADDAFADAVKAEAAFELGKAAEGYRTAIRERPSAGFALRARARLDELESHAEGDFVPLTKLERVRRDPRASSDAAALLALLEASREFPEGAVRRETWLLVAEGLARRTGRPAEALGPATQLLADEKAPSVMRAAALSIAVFAKESLGDRAGAAALARAHRVLNPTIAKRYDRDDRRAIYKRASIVVLFIVGFFGLWSGWQRPRALLRPSVRALSFLIVAALSAVVLRLYDASLSAQPFLVLTGGAFVVERAVTAARAAGTSRSLLVALGVLGVLAVAYLSLTMGEADLLGEFGL